MDNLEKIARFGSRAEWEIVAPGTNSGNPLDAAKSIKSETILLFDHFDGKAAKIKDSRELTAEGKKIRLSELGKANLEQVVKLRERLDPVDKAKGEAIHKARTAEKTPEEKIADLLMKTEIRRLLAEQVNGDPNQLKISYFDALKAGDFATCDSIETAPMLWPGRPNAETLEEWQAERLAVEVPKLSEEVGYLSDALTDTGGILDSVEGSIREVSGLPVDGGIEAIANGETANE